MQQRLIVEGNDAIVLANILMKKGISPPKDYSNPTKFKERFVKVAGSISKINATLKEQIDSPDVERIGIIVDANSKGAENRFKSLIDFIQKETEEDFGSAKLTPEGFHYKLKDKRVIGIWVMPDNQNEGYLENFVGSLIEDTNQTWQFVNAKVNELLQQDFCQFTKIKEQKALIHTYLAWQKSPGLPMGTAVEAGFLNYESPLVDRFINWFKNTFVLEEK